MAANKMMNPMRTGLNCCTLLYPTFSTPKRYNTINKPIIIHSATNTSLFKMPHCSTLSALAKNFMASASSIKPSTTFTFVIHPPDFGKDCSQLGNMANNAKGKPNAIPKPAAPAVSGHGPSLATLASKVPNIGPVQEKDTMANVPAIKNIPKMLPNPDLESALLASPDGKPISYRPKKENAKNTNTIKKIRLSQTLVEILLNISGLMVLLAI